MSSSYVTYKSWGRQIHVLRIFVLVLHKARKGSCRWPMKTERATWIRDTRNRPEKERKRERENERFMVTWPLTAGSKIFCYALQCTFFQSYPHVTRTWFASQIGKKIPLEVERFSRSLESVFRGKLSSLTKYCSALEKYRKACENEILRWRFAVENSCRWMGRNFRKFIFGSCSIFALWNIAPRGA